MISVTHLVKVLILRSLNCLLLLTFLGGKPGGSVLSVTFLYLLILENTLAFPFFHNRPSKHHFNYIIEKVQSKLAGWKSNTLMQSGRATIIQTVTSTIPSYSMQTMHLPISVCNKLDRINRNFLWGDTANKKKLHLVNWNQICKNQDLGGFGIRKSHCQNLALLTKLCLKMVTNEDTLWTNILKKKYLNNNLLFYWPNTRNASFTWKSMIKTLPLLHKSLKWVIGNGKEVDVWKDWWVGDGPLEVCTLGIILTRV